MSGVSKSGKYKEKIVEMDFQMLISNFWPLGEGFQGFGPQIRIPHEKLYI